MANYSILIIEKKKTFIKKKLHKKSGIIIDSLSGCVNGSCRLYTLPRDRRANRAGCSPTLAQWLLGLAPDPPAPSNNPKKRFDSRRWINEVPKEVFWFIHFHSFTYPCKYRFFFFREHCASEFKYLLATKAHCECTECQPLVLVLVLSVKGLAGVPF